MEANAAQYRRTCPNCGAAVGANANFCGNCSTPIVSPSVNAGGGKGLVIAGVAFAGILLVATAIFAVLYFRSSDGDAPFVQGERKLSIVTTQDSEIRDVVQKLLDVGYTKCQASSSYFARNVVEGIVEMKDVNIRWKTVPLDAADSANGIDLKVVATAEYKMIRNIPVSGAWSDWRVEDSFAPPPVYMIRRQRGQWQEGLTGKPLSFKLSEGKVRCIDIPGYEGPEVKEEAARQAARRAKEATIVRGIDLDAYCKALYSGSSAVNDDPSNPHAWRCLEAPTWFNQRNGPIYREIDMNSACRRQYGDDFKATVGEDGRSWRCVLK